MKRTVAFLAVATLAACAYAQGTLRFANDPSTLVQTMAPDGRVEPLQPNGGFVQFMWAPAGTSLSPWPGTSLSSWLGGNRGWELVEASKQAIGALPGRFNGGTLEIPTPIPGATIDAVVLGWVGNASSFDEALNRFDPANVSTAFTVNTANPLGIPEDPALIFGGPGQFRGLIIPIPEPSCLTLLIYGCSVWMVLRHRKCGWQLHQNSEQPNRALRL